MEQRQRFLDNGIPYEDIDVEMIDLIDVLNFDLGLKTQFCCYGHSEHDETYIVFDKEVDDNQIMSLTNHLIKEIGNFGSFNKWVRSDGISGIPMINWVYKSGWRFKPENFNIKKEVLDSFVETLSGLK